MKEIFDTTLRDGTQSENVNLTLYDKLSLVEALDGFGVDYIELGWPGSNPKDKEAFEEVKELRLKNARIVAFGQTHKKDVPAWKDKNLEAIVESGAPVACIFGKTWKEHVEVQIGATPEENLSLIGASVRFLKKKGLEVFYDAEHFFDGFKDDPGYALQTLEAAASAGATRLVLCDTNGGTLPHEFIAIVKTAHEHLKDKGIKAGLGVHVHNDSGVAVANSLLAAPYITQFQGTLNGFGERTGNADLCAIIPGLMLKMGEELPKIQLTKLKSLSKLAYDLANIRPNPSQSYVGDHAFSHKGGIHVDAISKGASYEHIDAALVGNQRRIVLSDLAGGANLAEICKSYGYGVGKDHPNMKGALGAMKEMEKKGYDMGTLVAEHYLLMKRFFSEDYHPITVRQWKVMTEARDGRRYSECVLVGRANGAEHAVVAPVEEEGPVGATFQALKKLVAYSGQDVGNVRLGNYKVRIAEDKGADSSVRVYTEFRDNGISWGTVGVSTDILEASKEALSKGFDYHLHTTREQREAAKKTAMSGR